MVHLERKDNFVIRQVIPVNVLHGEEQIGAQSSTYQENNNGEEKDLQCLLCEKRAVGNRNDPLDCKVNFFTL